MQITITLVKDSKGLIDEAASTATFTKALASLKVQRELEDGQIAKAVAAVFDKYKGASINLPGLCTYALMELGATPDNYNDMNEKIAEYVRANSDQGAVKDPKDKTKILKPAEAPRTRLFSMNKGRGGDTRRWSDVPTESK